MSDDKPIYEGWSILELMGHRRLGGYVREQELAGAAFLRIDVPSEDGEPAATQFYAAGAVYCLTPTTEELARAVALRNRPTPVQRWELPPARESNVSTLGRASRDDDEDDESEDDAEDPARVPF